MVQITHGLRGILSNPLIYSVFQLIMGARKGRQQFTENYIKPLPSMKILDVGCGPADILAYLPDAEYYGFDISADYIEKARSNFANKGTFFCKIFDEGDLSYLPKFDVVLAMGLLHHLDDEEAVQLIKLAHKALNPGGRLLTIDPCLVSGQNPIARFLINKDRGQNVRNEEAYLHLVEEVFESSCIDVKHQRWIPYTNCFMTCTK
ncbi:class I SAM-dependent methyltransferase [Eionea flava]